MTVTNKIRSFFIFGLLTILNISCQSHNTIDLNKIELDSLTTLPNNFYAFRRGRVYLEDLKIENYRIWFDLNDAGNISSVVKIDNFRNMSTNIEMTINSFKIDTATNKVYAQKFVELARKYGFGHLEIDKDRKVSFSAKEEMSEQYVKTLTDSMKSVYLKNKAFKVRENNWFENSED